MSSKLVSSKLIKRMIFIGVIGLVSGISGMYIWSQTTKNSIQGRGLASIGQIREKLPGKFLASSHSKHLSVISVRLMPPEKIPVDSQDSVELFAHVTLNQGPPEDLEIEWTVPEDVRVVSGDIRSQIPQAVPGHEYTLRLIVAGFNKTDQKIVSLSASTERNGISLGGSSLISSRPEDSMEYIAPRMAEGAREIDADPRATKIIK